LILPLNGIASAVLQYKAAKNPAVETRVEGRPTVQHESPDHDYVSMLYQFSLMHSTSLIISAMWLTSSGYWHQRADERHGNPPPR